MTARSFEQLSASVVCRKSMGLLVSNYGLFLDLRCNSCNSRLHYEGLKASYFDDPRRNVLTGPSVYRLGQLTLNTAR